MSAPSWLAFIALLCWAALFSPAQSQHRFVAGLLDGVDIPNAIMSLERHAPLLTDDRQRSDVAHNGNPPAQGLAARAAIDQIVLLIRYTAALTSLPAQQPIRSPAQPRAPPVSIHAG
ncbi:hypothetical protein JM946_01480 [Steroidobacter sp. S1-65]|uniref:Uncharacterized protein n=1 Tax=Steroidobacter gossypii TaxID=2805490 RepID=A0ABS1WQZ1_9GAMM|nr:hypothetical protein [Steroidobacter gossypii]MBM0103391.1 hypothetical protein [Steroidobacter gossypii]